MDSFSAEIRAKNGVTSGDPDPGHLSEETRTRPARVVLASCAIAVVLAFGLALIPVSDVSGVLLSFTALAAAVILALPACLIWRRSQPRVIASLFIPVGLFVALSVTSLPLRLTFLLFRPAFDRAASQIQAGNPPETPFWIGPYRIKMVGLRGDSDIPYLATNSEPWEINAFTKNPQGKGFALWSCTRLDGDWSYIEED